VPGSSAKRRQQARSLGSSIEASQHDNNISGRPASSPSVLPRHSRRQPSQTSSSGSQGNVSDSEGSVAAKRTTIDSWLQKVDAIREEPSAYAGMSSGSVQEFEPPPRTAPHQDEQRDSRLAPKNTMISPVTSSYDATNISRSPPVSSQVSEDSSVSSKATPPLKGKTPIESPSAKERAVPALSKSALEKANKLDMKNPLSQLLSGGSVNFDNASSSLNPLSQLINSGSVKLDTGSSANHSVNPSAAASPATSSAASFSVGNMSAMPTPFLEGASPFGDPLSAMPGSGPASPSGHSVSAPNDKVSVRILNGVSGEEEVRFPAPFEASFSEQHYYSMLDKLCQKHAGQSLSDMNWLSQAQSGARFQRRKCDLSMVEDLFSDDDASLRKGPRILLLCTVPAKPPSEMPANKVRLRNIIPSKVSSGATHPFRLQLDTSVLEADHQYTVAFTHQWTNVTYSTEASLLANHRGVELSVPWQILTGAASATDGLYDVHLVTDCSSRSENRRCLTVGSAESEFSSSSIGGMASSTSFVPLSTNK